MATNMKPTVQHQGKIVAEFDGRGWLIMYPDGSVEGGAISRDEVEQRAKAWFKLNINPEVVGVGMVEYKRPRWKT